MIPNPQVSTGPTDPSGPEPRPERRCLAPALLAPSGLISGLLQSPRSLVLLLALVALLAPVGAAAQSPDRLARFFSEHDPESDQTVDHSAWGRLLGRYASVDSAGIGRFDYASVSDDDIATLDAYLRNLQALDPRRLSRDEQLAYWANLYNAATIRVMLRHWPVESIREIRLPPSDDGPWDAPLVKVAGQKLTLNEIEHQVMRPVWREPRIHYMVNCASVGCPNLATTPWTADDLDARLEAAAAAFLRHPRAVRIEAGQLVLSNLLEWYRQDFVEPEAPPGPPIEYLVPYLEKRLASRVGSWDGPVVHEYDWAVNAPDAP